MKLRVRKARFGWEASYEVTSISTPPWRPTPLYETIWRPTKNWAINAAKYQQAKHSKRYRKYWAIGEYKWENVEE